MSGLVRTLRNALDGVYGVLDDSARYWQERAAAQSPAERVIESVHPLYAVGSAMGSVREAAQNGDFAGTALGAAGALPTFGMLKHVDKATKALDGMQYMQTARQGLRANTVGNTGNVGQPVWDNVKGY